MKKLLYVFFTLWSIIPARLSAQTTREINAAFSKDKQHHTYEVDVPAGIPFTGLTAYTEDTLSATGLHLQFRVRTENGWQDWVSMEENHEGNTPGRKTFIAPFIEDPFSEIQFNATGEAPVTFRLYFPAPEKKSPARSSKTQSDSACSCAQPSFCGRDCWCPSGLCPKDSTPEYTAPTHLIIHHSAGNTNSTDFAAVVGFYWDYHVNTNGWDDIGYNWLIDPDGVIYEGRGDSLAGSHFSCMNSNTNGVCLIGNFETAMPAGPALGSLTSLLAYQSCLYNIAPLGSSVHGPSQLFLSHISGHRDGNSATVGCPKGTVCPGDNLYALLPAIAQDVAGQSCLGALSSGSGLDERNARPFQVYPNPAEGFLTVEGGFEDQTAGILKIYDMSGKTRAIHVLPLLPSPVTIDTGELKEGMYIVEVRQEGGEKVFYKIAVK